MSASSAEAGPPSTQGPNLTFITLGVRDLEISLRFYRVTLGWQDEQRAEYHYFPAGSARLALYSLTSLAREAGLTAGKTQDMAAFCGITLSHNVSSSQEVLQLMERIHGSDGRVVKPAQETNWGGFAGFFQDPDGYLWEVVWNPRLTAD